ncbi:Arabinanolytic transcriptional activator araR [Fusarium oxysporum f. sp. albedinis]|nr:Arabinanolytic transcriptional activator araR [Fusarium oxysporum f. sp. albedinis]
MLGRNCILEHIAYYNLTLDLIMAGDILHQRKLEGFRDSYESLFELLLRVACQGISQVCGEKLQNDWYFTG